MVVAVMTLIMKKITFFFFLQEQCGDDNASNCCLTEGHCRGKKMQRPEPRTNLTTTTKESENGDDEEERKPSRKSYQSQRCRAGGAFWRQKQRGGDGAGAWRSRRAAPVSDPQSHMQPTQHDWHNQNPNNCHGNNAANQAIMFVCSLC